MSVVRLTRLCGQGGRESGTGSTADPHRLAATEDLTDTSVADTDRPRRPPVPVGRAPEPGGPHVDVTVDVVGVRLVVLKVEDGVARRGSSRRNGPLVVVARRPGVSAADENGGHGVTVVLTGAQSGDGGEVLVGGTYGAGGRGGGVLAKTQTLGGPETWYVVWE